MNKKYIIIPLALSIFCAWGINAMEPFPKRRKIDLPDNSPLRIADEHFSQGNNYYAGLNGVMQDRDMALDYFVKAAGLEHAEAQYKVARMLIAGDGVVQNIQWGLMYLKAAASKRHPEANYLIGVKYLDDDANSILAFNHLFIAAQEGNVYARYIIGKILLLSYMNGRPNFYLCNNSSNPNLKNMVLYLGENPSMDFLEMSDFEYELSFKYLKGTPQWVKILKESPDVKFMWSEIFQSFTDAQQLGAPQDGDFDYLLQLGLEYLHSAAAQDHLEAIYFIGKIAVTQYKTKIKLDDVSSMYLKRAAYAGHADAQVDWARMLATGKDNVKKDTVCAAAWAQKALNQHNSLRAKSFLASYIMSDNGIEQNYDLAFKYCKELGANSLLRRKLVTKMEEEKVVN